MPNLFDRIRILPRKQSFLDRIAGSSGQIYTNKDTGSLRIYDGDGPTGVELARADFQNTTTTAQLDLTSQKNKVRFDWELLQDLQTEVDPTVYRGMVAHVNAEGRLYFAHGGNWTPVANLSEVATDEVFVSVKADSGEYSSLDSQSVSINGGTNISTEVSDNSLIINLDSLSANVLSDIDTNTVAPSNGQVLKWNGSQWVPSDDTGKTESEIRSIFSASGDLSYNADTGEFSVSVPQGYDSTDFDSDFSEKTTDNLSQGDNNLYYSDTLVQNVIDQNTAGFITDYTVTEEDVTQYEASLTISQSQVSDLSIPTNTSDLTNDSGFITTESDTLDDVTTRNNTTSNAISTGGITSNGVVSIEQGSRELLSTITNATGTVTHDCANGYIFFHSSPNSNWIANFTNLDLTTNYATVVTLVVDQATSAYVPSGVEIEGVTQTIVWAGAVLPTGTANGTDVISFTIIDRGSFTVLGQLGSFGG